MRIEGINETNKEQKTALHSAAGKKYRAKSGNYIEIIKHLIKAGASVNLPDKDGLTTLAIAKQEGHADIIELLKQFGGKEKVIYATEQGIHITNFNGAIDMFEKKIKWKGNTKIYTEYGLFLYQQGEYQEAVNKLERAIALGADREKIRYRQHKKATVSIEKEPVQKESDETVIEARWLAYNLLIRCYQALKEEERAWEIFGAFSKELSQSTTVESIAYQLLGDTCQYLGETETAELCYEVVSLSGELEDIQGSVKSPISGGHFNEVKEKVAYEQTTQLGSRSAASPASQVW